MFAAHNIRYSVKASIAWVIIAEIIRRCGQRSNLRVIETHPGGGQYDLLCLLKVDSEDSLVHEHSNQVLAEFNLGSGEFSSPFMDSSDRYPWLERWLINDDPDNAIDAMLPLMGLHVDRYWPPTDRVIFGFRLVAAILTSQMASKYFLLARNGFVDTSGEGSGVATSLSSFPLIFENHLSGKVAFDVDSASKCWLLYQGLERVLVGCVRMDGVISSIEYPNLIHDLFPLYLETKKMSAVTSAALRVLGIR